MKKIKKIKRAKKTLKKIIIERGDNIFCADCEQAIFFKGEQKVDFVLISYMLIFNNREEHYVEMICKTCWLDDNDDEDEGEDWKN